MDERAKACGIGKEPLGGCCEVCGDWKGEQALHQLDELTGCQNCRQTGQDLDYLSDK